MEITANSIQLDMVFDSVLYPVDIEALIASLNAKDYLLAQPGKTTPKGIPMQKGDTAFKGNVVLRINPTVQKIRFVGMNETEMIQILNEVVKAFDACGGNSEKNVKYYEFIIHIEIHTNKEATDTVASFLSPVSTAKIDEILGLESELFTIRLTPKNRNPNSAEYYELVVEPLRRNFGKSYYCFMDYRTGNYKKLQNLLSNITDNIANLISVIEK